MEEIQPAVHVLSLELRIKQVRKLVFPAGALIVEVSADGKQLCQTCEIPVVNGHAEVEAWTRLALKPPVHSLELTVRLKFLGTMCSEQSIN
jgi:hypothetical protein